MTRCRSCGVEVPEAGHCISCGAPMRRVSNNLCNQCGREYPSPRMLGVHLMVAHGLNVNPPEAAP
jgi:predicted amidophosphoribosyltransferase